MDTYLMKLEVEHLDELQKKSLNKRTDFETPILVKSRFHQYVITVEKGEYLDYISPCVLELDLKKLDEIYLILDFSAAKAHDVLVNTEKYSAISFNEELYDVLLKELDN